LVITVNLAIEITEQLPKFFPNLCKRNRKKNLLPIPIDILWGRVVMSSLY